MSCLLLYLQKQLFRDDVPRPPKYKVESPSPVADAEVEAEADHAEPRGAAHRAAAATGAADQSLGGWLRERERGTAEQAALS